MMQRNSNSHESMLPRKASGKPAGLEVDLKENTWKTAECIDHRKLNPQRGHANSSAFKESNSLDRRANLALRLLLNFQRSHEKGFANGVSDLVQIDLQVVDELV